MRFRSISAESARALGATCFASSFSGAAVGVKIRYGQDAEPGASSPPRILGSTPAANSEDLPDPDTPDTTSSSDQLDCPEPFSSPDIRSSTLEAASSRPKKILSSSSENASSPRYGESRDSGGRVLDRAEESRK
ncbi:MAG: hypothetical protein H0V92_07495 [Pseudonocardiales bacterium]|nr:hypothetical protein [Pseudonocardiales bacterium]